MAFSWISFIGAFGGGALGAAMGAMSGFVLVGALVLVGVSTAAGGGDRDVLAQVAFGPVFGPHVCFAGGVAAAAYAARRGVLKSGRDLSLALMGVNRSDVLVVGGLFGILGYLVNLLLSNPGVARWTDTIAATVVLSGVVARGAFTRRNLLGTVVSSGRRFHPDEFAHWLPWQQRPSQVLVIGLGMAIASSYLAHEIGYAKGGDVLGFGIATLLLAFLVYGVRVPMTHHIALPAAVGVVLSSSFTVGIVAGVAAAAFAELFSRAVLIHSDTHIDPPAAAIAAMTTVLKIAESVGLFHNLRLP